MEKLTLGLLECDEEYVRLFSSYMRASPYRDKCILKIFTKPENVLSYSAAEEPLSLLLASPRHGAALRRSGLAVPILRLSGDDLPDAAETLPEAPAVEKYQPLNRLLDAVWRAAEEMGAGVLAGGECAGPAPRSACRVLAFYSAVGGCGKTTIAANLARLLAFRGQRVLYASLEGLPSAPVFPKEEENAMERLLYLVKSGVDALAGKADRLKHHDPRTKVDYLLPPEHLSEMENMTEDNVRVWIDALRRSAAYDTILLDLDSTLHVRAMGAIRCCDELVWVITDDVHGIYKARLLFAELVRRTGMEEPGRLERKTSFLLNKYTGSTANDLASAGFSPDGQLPYVPGWKGVGNVDTLFADSGFQEQLLRWFYAERRAPVCHSRGTRRGGEANAR